MTWVEHQWRPEECPICGLIRYVSEEERRGSGGCTCWIDEEERMAMEITKTNEENRVTDALIEARECLVEIQGYLVGANCPYTRQRIDKTLDMIREALK